MNHPEIANALRAFIDGAEVCARTSRGRHISQLIADLEGMPWTAEDAGAEREELVKIEKVSRCGWELVDQLTNTQLDTQDLRRFLHYLDYNKQASAWELWIDLMPQLKGIADGLHGRPSEPPASFDANLTDGAKRLLNALYDGKPYKGAVLAAKAKLTYDAARKLLARLKRAGRITHKRGEGYRLAGNVLNTC